jgi:hypothetical protein
MPSGTEYRVLPVPPDHPRYNLDRVLQVERLEDCQLYETALKRHYPITQEMRERITREMLKQLEEAQDRKETRAAVKVLVMLDQFNLDREKLEVQKAGMRHQHQHVHFDLSKMTEEDIEKLASKYRQGAIASAGKTEQHAGAAGAGLGGGDREGDGQSPGAQAGGDGLSLDRAIECLNQSIIRLAGRSQEDAAADGTTADS